MLADNGIDVEEFEKSLPDDVLKKVDGGYEDIIGDSVHCPWCKENRYDEISYQCIPRYSAGSILIAADHAASSSKKTGMMTKRSRWSNWMKISIRSIKILNRKQLEL
ncbi:MAG: hypothetical protein IKI61_08620 [Erysipelotrichaceae bacterium]|nr:hypothetical protein [Erysipelotrichaceae bacterium]